MRKSVTKSEITSEQAYRMLSVVMPKKIAGQVLCGILDRGWNITYATAEAISLFHTIVFNDDYLPNIRKSLQANTTDRANDKSRTYISRKRKAKHLTIIKIECYVHNYHGKFKNYIIRTANKRFIR